jgi:tetratricopeptide (TPR) repeat protein
MSEMPPEIRIEIEKIGDKQYRSRVLTDEGQEIVTNDFSYDPELLYNIEAQKYLEMDGGRSDEEVESDFLPLYGQKLYRYLFGDGSAFSNFLKFNHSAHVRINLCLHPEAAPLWSVPWEYIHNGKEALAITGRYLISRIPRGIREIPVPKTPMPPPLRILVLISSPDDQPELNTEREIEAIQDALDDAQVKRIVKVDFLEEATLENIRDAVMDDKYHIIHYTGHGGRDEATGGSFLALEDDNGKMHPTTGIELKRNLAKAEKLRMIVLSGCLTAQTSYTDALRGVATTLLESGIPVVLAMQYSILDKSGIEFASSFYKALGTGLSPEEALAQTRVSLCNLRTEVRADWGIPALYLRTQSKGLCFVDPEAEAVKEDMITRYNVGGLQLPRGFVGRKKEIREIKRAIEDRRRPFIYIWGIGGVGKTALAAKVLEKVEDKLEGFVAIECNKESIGIGEILQKLHSFFIGRGTEGSASLGNTLLDSRIPIEDRVNIMAQNTANNRYLFVFDNFEYLLTADRKSIADENLKTFFYSIFHNNWRSCFIFTSRFKFDLLDKIPAGNILDRHLEGLTPRQAIMFMNNLDRLSKEPLEDKLKAFETVGGHPKTIEFLDSYTAERPLKDILEDPEVKARLDEELDRYFMGELYSSLNNEERSTLQRLCVFRSGFELDAVTKMSGSTHVLDRLIELSLLQSERVKEMITYRVHPVVRVYVFTRIDEPEKENLHLKAAEYFKEKIDIQREQQGMFDIQHALDMHFHFFHARKYVGAYDIVQKIMSPLDQWGMRDLLKDLLRQSIGTLEGYYKALAMGNMAQMFYTEGRYDDALSIYEGTFNISKDLDEKQNMAINLGNQAVIHRLKGEYDKTIELENEALAIRREINDEKGIGLSLLGLSIIYRIKGDLNRAWDMCTEGLKFFKKINDNVGIQKMIYQQGIILQDKEQYPEAYNKYLGALVMAENIDYKFGIAGCCYQIGQLLSQTKQVSEAIKYYYIALDYFRNLNYPDGISRILTELGGIHERQAQYQEALVKFQEAFEIMKNLNPGEAAKFVIAQ